VEHLRRFFILLYISSFVSLVSLPLVAQEKFVVPEDELTKEVALPKFDRREVIKNSRIKFLKRLELGLFGGSNFTEPIYNPLKLGVELGYHWAEIHSAHFSLSQWLPGFNRQYVPAISAQSTPQYEFDRVPTPQMSFWGYYNLKAYYGKISLSKKETMNLSLYTQYGVGFSQFSHKMYPGIAVGVGQKFYFNNHFGIKAEIRLQYQGQPNPFLGDGQLKKGEPIPSHSQFGDIMRFGTIFELGGLWMF
jgi:outer membrane beta-barrel protein